MSEARYLVGDVFDRLADIPDGSIDLIVTSPPFLALRSYLPADHPDKGKEIGSEATPADFLTTLLALTAEWRRVLAPHGSLCVELGDTYSGSGGAGGDYGDGGLREGQQRFDGSASKAYGTGAAPRPARGRFRTPGRDSGKSANNPSTRAPASGWPLDKSLCLLPTLYPASLAYGRNLLTGEPCEPWRIRNQIVWHRPNPPVGALGDKVRPSTSYVTVACTSRTRWFDLDAERTPYKNPERIGQPISHTATEVDYADGVKSAWSNKLGMVVEDRGGAPPLDCWQDTSIDDVWTLSTQPYKGSHYATFPITLPRKLINLMCPRSVCTSCGEPRRRIVETSNLIDGKPAAEFEPDPRKRAGWSEFADNPHAKGVQAEHHINNNRLTQQRDTLGWTECGCRFDPVTGDIIGTGPLYRRGIVLDPFAGSGTTLVAASELGRDSIGIDIDERNLDLARERIGMFLIDEPEAVAL